MNRRDRKNLPEDSSAGRSPRRFVPAAPSRRALILGLAALPACGFTPAYGPGGAAAGLRGTIVVDPPFDESGYILVRHLEERLGRPTAAAYRLSADIRLMQEGLGVTPDQEITRYRLRGLLDYRLIRLADESLVAEGMVQNFTSYSAPVYGAGTSTVAGDPVSILTAEADAQERLMSILADQLVARLLATASAWRT